MKICIVTCAAAISASCSTAVEPLPLVSEAHLPLGYVVSVADEGRTCLYVIQDMVTDDLSFVREWMRDLPGKDKQVDVVITFGGVSGCARNAYDAVRDGNFTTVHLRDATDPEFGRLHGY